MNHGRRPGAGASTPTAIVRGLVRVLALAALFAAVGCAPEDSIRMRAANDFHCPGGVKIQRVGDFSFHASGCGQAGTYFYQYGRSAQPYVMGPVPDPAPASAQPPAPPKPPPLLAPPAGAGGFALGATQDDVRRVCEQAGHAYQPKDEGHASCDGLAVDIGVPAHAALAFCDGRLCTVDIDIPLAPGDDLARGLDRWRAELVTKYGGPSAARSDIPLACASDASPCLLHGTAVVRFDWRWPSGQRIALGPWVDGSRGASVDITYTQGKVETNPGL